jgi:hypothetical protein
VENHWSHSFIMFSGDESECVEGKARKGLIKRKRTTII